MPHEKDAALPLESIAERRFLRLVKRGGWEWVQRTNASGIVGIAALTPSGAMLLIEQFRPPVGARVIEIPAGLAGDDAGAEGEPLDAAARRELLEETGYEAEEMLELLSTVASAGLTDEEMTLFLARGLRKTTSGGGVAGENITIHEAPLADLDRWLAEKQQAGIKVDGRVLAAAYILLRRA